MQTSAAYRSPELTSVLHPCTLDERVDIWALGCALYAIAFGGRSPFEDAVTGQVLKLGILNAKYSYPKASSTNSNSNSNSSEPASGDGVSNGRGCTYSREFCGLLDNMLAKEIEQRPFAREIVERVDSRLVALGKF